MWNNLDLKPPPTNSYSGLPKTVDTKLLRKSLNDCENTFAESKRSLDIDSAILSRMIYRFKRRFYKDKGMKCLQKLNTSIHRYLQLNVSADIRRFLKSIPTEYQSSQPTVYYPTKQMLEYVMLRLQAFAKLMVRIVEICLDTAQLMISRMMLGHFWNIAYFILAISSRISVLCQHMLDATCVCFDNLVVIVEQLQPYGLNFLESEYKFPFNLRDWLKISWSIADVNLIAQKRIEIPILTISDDDDDDVQFCYEYKNKCIVIDDTINIAEDDVEFVNEYIDLFTQLNKKRNTKVSKNVVEITSDRGSPIPLSSGNENESDVELMLNADSDEGITCIEPIKTTVDDSVILISEPTNNISAPDSSIRGQMLTEDVGEILTRKKPRRKKRKLSSTENLKNGSSIFEQTLSEDVGEILIRKKPRRKKRKLSSTEDDDDNLIHVIEPNKTIVDDSVILISEPMSPDVKAPDSSIFEQTITEDVGEIFTRKKPRRKKRKSSSTEDEDDNLKHAIDSIKETMDDPIILISKPTSLDISTLDSSTATRKKRRRIKKKLSINRKSLNEQKHLKNVNVKQKNKRRIK